MNNTTDRQIDDMVAEHERRIAEDVRGQGPMDHFTVSLRSGMELISHWEDNEKTTAERVRAQADLTVPEGETWTITASLIRLVTGSPTTASPDLPYHRAMVERAVMGVVAETVSAHAAATQRPWIVQQKQP